MLNTNLSLLYSSVYKCSLINKFRAIWCNLLGIRSDVFIGLQFEADVNTRVTSKTFCFEELTTEIAFVLLKVAHNIF